MQKICKGEEKREQLEKNYLEACQNEKFQKLVKSLELTKEEGMKKTSKLETTIEELSHCEKCKGLFECKNSYLGHVSMPKKEEGMLLFTYEPCKYKKKENIARRSDAEKNKQARMKDIDVSDKNRVKVIKWLDQFYENFDFSKPQKGLYLCGSFGSGKTFLISALLNELEEKKNVRTKLIYFPEALIDLKDWDTYEYQMRYLETVDILCIDDIGAEKVSEWSRDEVLATILQNRMNHHLPTFFTSNLNLEELETHLQGKEKDKLKARRIMERMKQLSEEIILISENRRN